MASPPQRNPYEVLLEYSRATGVNLLDPRVAELVRRAATDPASLNTKPPEVPEGKVAIVDVTTGQIIRYVDDDGSDLPPGVPPPSKELAAQLAAKPAAKMAAARSEASGAGDADVDGDRSDISSAARTLAGDSSAASVDEPGDEPAA